MYIPEPVPREHIDEYLARELQRISAEFHKQHDIEERNTVPDKLINGMIRYADGTNWNPGSGKGLYIYLNSAWHFLAEFSSAGYWDDYTADIGAAKPGASSPPGWTAFRNGISAYAFDNNSMEEVQVNFHINHDFKAGTKVYPHIHWSPGNSVNTGVVRWGIEYSFSKGHEQEAFPATTTIYVEQAGEGTAYTHQIAEVSTEDALDSSSIEPDTVILTRIFRDGAHENDTFPTDAFCFEVDLHYQKDRTGTENKAPDFYA